MASTYFTVPSFARAKKNKEDLEKTNPQDPVLKDEDEKFLERHMSTDQAAEPSEVLPAAKITDDGVEKEATKDEQEQTSDSVDQAVIPETQPDTDGVQEGGQSAAAESQSPESSAEQPSYDDTMKEKAAERVRARKEKKRNKSFELPSQEEAEAATRGFNAQTEQQTETTQGEKRTWASYIPRYGAKKTTADPNTSESTEEAQPTDQDTAQKTTWTQKAAAYVPNISNIPISSLRPSSRDKDAVPSEPVYNEDGTINEQATQEKQEREVSVLLDNLNMSSINNRVFAFSAETQKYYERFAQCLKDIINGAPTAYEDMDKLMKEAGPKLEQQFKSMPPFVQTLVKSLPARLGSTLGPELLAVASEKPGNDMNAKLSAASKRDTSSSGVNVEPATSSTSDNASDDPNAKKKRRIPGLKSLVSSQSGVTSLLRNISNFLTTRFPFLASTTNVVMSLAVFILMFVFWYCHKRGREVRLAREADEGGEAVEEGDVLEVEVSDDEEEGKEMTEEELAALEREVEEKAGILDQPDPSEVPLPEKEGEEVKAEEKPAAAQT